MRQQRYSYDSEIQLRHRDTATTATRSMNQPANNVAREKRKGKGRGRVRSPGAKTVNRTHGAARPGPLPGSKNNQATPRRASPFCPTDMKEVS